MHRDCKKLYKKIIFSQRKTEDVFHSVLYFCVSASQFLLNLKSFLHCGEKQLSSKRARNAIVLSQRNSLLTRKLFSSCHKTDFPQRTSSWLPYSACLLKQNFLTIITRQVNSAMQFLIALDASVSDPVLLTLNNRNTLHTITEKQNREKGFQF